MRGVGVGTAWGDKVDGRWQVVGFLSEGGDMGISTKCTSTKSKTPPALLKIFHTFEQRNGFLVRYVRYAFLFCSFARGNSNV